MPLSEFELRKIKKLINSFCSRHSRAEGINRCDFTYRVLDNEVWMFERRPRWDNPNEWHEFAFARASCDLDTRLWTLYRQGHDLNWQQLRAFPPTRNFEKVIEHIDCQEDDIFHV